MWFSCELFSFHLFNFYNDLMSYGNKNLFIYCSISLALQFSSLSAFFSFKVELIPEAVQCQMSI